MANLLMQRKRLKEQVIKQSKIDIFLSLYFFSRFFLGRFFLVWVGVPSLYWGKSFLYKGFCQVFCGETDFYIGKFARLLMQKKDQR